MTQETLEEVAKRLYPNGCDGTDRSAEIYRRIFIEGAKWQQKKDIKEIKPNPLLMDEVAHWDFRRQKIDLSKGTIGFDAYENKEVIEEVVDRLYLNRCDDCSIKPAQERSYSEEDLECAWNSSDQNMRFQFSSSAYKGITFKQWLEKFKQEISDGR